MPNILTDNSATYAAGDVFTGAKTNAITRAATESDTYVTAQWGIEVDTGLQSINEFFVGDSSAGQAGTTMTMLGGVDVAENGGFAGASASDVPGTGVAIGSTAIATNDLQIQASGNSRILFGDAADIDVGILDYDHGTNTFAVTINATSIGTLATSGITWGTGAAAVELTLDGGATPALEPAVAFQVSSVEVARIQAENDGRLSLAADGGLSLPSLTTVQRVGLTQVAGHIVWDSDLGALYTSNGTTWSELSTATRLFDVTAYGAIGDGVADDYTAIASALTAASAVTSGVVYFPPGTYLVSQTLRRPSGVSMLGAGVPGTIIRGDNLTSQPVVGTTVTAWTSSPTVRAGYIKNILIDNQDRANAGAIGLQLAGAYDCVVEAVTVQNVETGVELIHSSYWNKLSAVRAAVVDTGFRVTNGSNENRFSMCHVTDCEIGYVVSEGADSGCSNTMFDQCAAEQFNAGSQYGYHLTTTLANAVDNVTIIAPRLERSVSGGTGIIRTGTVRNVSIEDPFLVNISTPFSGLGDDSRVKWRGQEKRGLRVGVMDDYATTSHALLNYSSGSGRVLLREDDNLAYEELQVSQLFLENGVRFADGTGTPEGVLVAGRGSVYLDDATGDLYTKTTTTGNTGWVRVGGTYSDNMGWTSAVATPYYLPIASGVAASGTLDMQHIWRSPVAGTLSQAVVTSTNSTGNSTFNVYESDGTTLLDTDGDTSTTFTFGAGTGHILDFNALSVTLAVGDLICFELDTGSSSGQASCFIIVDL